jgi:hypothetical protein
MASGNRLVTWTALAGEPPASNFATGNVRKERYVLEFDTTTEETAFFMAVMPAQYAGGNIKVAAVWMAKEATSGTIGWKVTFERLNAEQDLDEEGFATAQTITATTVPAASGKPATTEVTCTAGATGTDSVAAGDLFRLRVQRDVTNDNAAGDAQLLAVFLTEA